MIELGFILVGVVMLTLVIVFKKQINNYYDNAQGLSKSHAKFYKSVVVFLVPAIFIVFGVVLLIVAKLDVETKQLVIENMKSNYLNFNFILGVLMILFGITTSIIKLTDYKYKAIAKLKPMEESYGKTWGNVIHFLGYSVAPIGFGVYLLYRILFLF